MAPSGKMKPLLRLLDRLLLPISALLVLLLAVWAGLTLASGSIGRRIDARLGVIQSLYSSPDFSGPALLTRPVTTFDLSFTGTEVEAPQRLFSVRWTGLWDVQSDRVDLYAGADDEVAIFVDDQLVLARNPRIGMSTTSHTLRVSRGLHRLRVEYVQYGGSAHINLLWAPDGGRPRPLAPETLFFAMPDDRTLSTARRAYALREAAEVAWKAAEGAFILLLVAVLPFLWRRHALIDRLVLLIQPVRLGYDRAATWRAQHPRLAMGLFAALLAAVTLRTLFARLPGLNPESLWYDDLVWAALTRAEDLRSMLEHRTQAPPGFLVLLRVSRTLFRDPEWSVQLPAFVFGVAAIPVMALAVRQLTRSQGLALLAAALTSLNPLLAHYTLYVKQYSLDFLMTALLLLAAGTLLDGRAVRPSHVAQLTIFSGLGLLCSASSVFVSVPTMAVVALRASLGWRRRTLAVLLTAGTFAAILIAAYFLYRSRMSVLRNYDFREDLLGRSYEFSRLWRFLATDARRIVEMSLPSWTETEAWNPETVSWTLPFVGLGLIWLFVRKSSRAIGWIVIGFVAAFFLAGYANLYPLEHDRRSIFAFPVFIYLSIMGLHLVTEWLPKREVFRLLTGLAVAGFALYAPIRTLYWPVNDVRLIERLSVSLAPTDGLILSPGGEDLAAYYGGWPVVITRGATIVRPLTLRFRDRWTREAIDHFLEPSRPARLWYVAYRSVEEEKVLQALIARGYTLTPVERTTRGRLYLGALR
jgi:hypothetical protein